MLNSKLACDAERLRRWRGAVLCRIHFFSGLRADLVLEPVRNSCIHFVPIGRLWEEVEQEDCPGLLAVVDRFVHRSAVEADPFTLDPRLGRT